MRLQIVDHAGRVDQTRLLRRGVDDEPRIDGDAMPAHTRPRLKDIDPRVTVGQPGQLPDIDTELFADDRQFVGERSEEHTSELKSLMRNSYAVFCLKKKTT